MRIESLGWTPVKGSQWLGSDEHLLTTDGLAGDRLWSPVLTDVDGVGLRCVRATDLPQLAGVRILPDELPARDEHLRFDGASQPVRYYDRTFGCTIHGGPVAERLSRAAGTDLLLARTTGTAGFIWSSPVSILLRSEVEALGLPTDLGRYRANLVVDDRDAPLSLGAGSILAFGEVRLVVERELDRCLVVNHDPVTGEHDEDLLHRLRPGVLLGHGARVESGGLLRAGGPAGLWQG